MTELRGKQGFVWTLRSRFLVSFDHRRRPPIYRPEKRFSSSSGNRNSRSRKARPRRHRCPGEYTFHLDPSLRRVHSNAYTAQFAAVSDRFQLPCSSRILSWRGLAPNAWQTCASAPLDYAAIPRACDTRPTRMAFNFQRLRAPSRPNSPPNRATFGGHFLDRRTRE